MLQATGPRYKGTREDRVLKLRLRQRHWVGEPTRLRRLRERLGQNLHSEQKRLWLLSGENFIKDPERATNCTKAVNKRNMDAWRCYTCIKAAWRKGKNAAGFCLTKLQISARRRGFEIGKLNRFYKADQDSGLITNADRLMTHGSVRIFVSFESVKAVWPIAGREKKIAAKSHQRGMPAFSHSVGMSMMSTDEGFLVFLFSVLRSHMEHE